MLFSVIGLWLASSVVQHDSECAEELVSMLSVVWEGYFRLVLVWCCGWSALGLFLMCIYPPVSFHLKGTQCLCLETVL